MRFIRVVFFTLRIIVKYMFTFLMRRILPNFIYAKLLTRVNIRVAKKMKKYFFKLQGIYIKVGQFWSVVGNIFAPEIAKHLKELQDKVPTRDYSLLKPIFLKYWGKEPHEVLENFRKKPIASASLGQVYTGFYKGEKVAVKVLYPSIKEIIEKDLQTLKTVMNILQFFFPALDLSMIYNEFSDMLFKEVDFKYEKSNLNRLKTLLKKEKQVVIPGIIEDLTRGDIIVTEFIDGCKIDNVEEIKAMGHDPQNVAKKLLDIYSEMIFKFGFFHSDPHPGNLIFTNDGKIGVIDFGAADTISNENIMMVRKILKAFLFKDIPMMVQYIEDIGFLRPSADKEEVEKIAYFLIKRLLAFEAKDYQRMTLNEIYKLYNLKIIGVRFQQLLKYMQIPKNFLFLERTIAILLGVASKLDPQMNIIKVLIPHLRKFLLGKNENMGNIIKEEVKANFHYISQLPENVHKTLETINSGKIKVNLKELKKDVKKMYILGHQFIYTFLLVASAIFSLVFYLHDKKEFSKISSIISVVFTLILTISFIRNRKD